jgi:hypothetical protein
MIILSGLAGALSWLFYFRAIQLGSSPRSPPIDKLSMPLAVLLAVLLLQERPSGMNWLGNRADRRRRVFSRPSSPRLDPSTPTKPLL